MKMWQFREIKAIEEPVFNNTLEKFYNLGIDGLVRENEYSYAAEPPVQFRLSHLSRRSEPL